MQEKRKLSPKFAMKRCNTIANIKKKATQIEIHKIRYQKFLSKEKLNQLKTNQFNKLDSIIPEEEYLKNNVI